MYSTGTLIGVMVFAKTPENVGAQRLFIGGASQARCDISSASPRAYRYTVAPWRLQAKRVNIAITIL
jgi:hypothetical protein